MDVIPLKINKILTILFVFCITSIVCATSAFADYTITVPQNVTLTSSATGTGTYSGTASVKIAGSIDDDEQLCVSTPSTLTMSNGHKNIDATVSTSSKTIWSKDEVTAGQAQNNYNISAILTPGTWTGAEIFYVSMGKIYDITVGDNSVSLIAQNENLANIKFSSNAPEIATVDSTGHVQTVSVGNTTITKMVYDSTGEKLLYTTVYDITVSAKPAEMVTTRLVEPLKTITSAGITIDTISFGQYTIPSNTTTYDVSGDGSNTIQAFVDGTVLKVTNTKATPVKFASDNSLSFGQNSTFSSIKTIKYESVDTSEMTSLNGAFRDLTSLQTIIGLENINTSNVVDMAYMFRGCSALTSVDASTFDTSKVTTMEAMFSRCVKLANVDVSNFDTTNVKNMYCMFYMCQNVPYLNVSSFNTSNVTDMHGLFEDCEKLTNVDVSGFDTHNVKDMSGMFSRCYKLTSIDVSGFDTSNVTDFHCMFGDCYIISELDVSNFNTKKAVCTYGMFIRCKALPTLDVSSFDMSSVTDSHAMFFECNLLTSIKVGANTLVSNLPTAGGKTGLFYVSTKTPLVVLGNVSAALKSYDFATDNRIIQFGLATFDTSRLTPIMTTLVSSGKTIKTISFGSYDIPSGTTTYDVSGTGTGLIVAFVSGTELRVTNTDKTPLRFATGNSLKFTLDANSGLNTITTINYNSVDTSRVTLANGVFAAFVNLTSINGLNKWDTSNVTAMGRTFSGCEKLASIDVSSFDTSKVTNMAYMFHRCLSLTSINLNSWNTSKVTTMAHMFEFDAALTSVNASNLNTSAVTDMYCMFSGCTKLPTVDVSKWNTGKVANFKCMFLNCSALSKVNVSNFNTQSATNINSMFSGCSSLTTVDVSGFVTDKVTDMACVFYGCSSLTKCDVSKFNTANVTNFSGMFAKCSKLTVIDVSKFNTSKATDIHCMFEKCTSVTTLNVSGFNTANVTSLYGLFSYCEKVTALDVSKFQTGKVADFHCVFEHCYAITTLNVSNFDTRAATSMSGFFGCCTKLTSISVGSNFATVNLPSAGTDGMFYTTTKSSITIKGTASSALKSYNFSADNRTATFTTTLDFPVSDDSAVVIFEDELEDSFVQTPETAASEVIATPESAQLQPAA